MNSFDVGRVPPITFGVGCVSEVPGIVTALGGDTVLVVADAALQELGVVTRLAEDLGSAGLRCELAPEIVGEPKEALIDKLSARARASDVNLVIGIGGGAAMDAAKLIAAIAPSATSAETYALGAVPLPSVGLPA
ncbi:MAG: iron-containing alcohol dehydrogenase, partial [Pseudomonadota bacterium]